MLVTEKELYTKKCNNHLCRDEEQRKQLYSSHCNAFTDYTYTSQPNALQSTSTFVPAVYYRATPFMYMYMYIVTFTELTHCVLYYRWEGACHAMNTFAWWPVHD